jgi:hypothetical protein
MTRDTLAAALIVWLIGAIVGWCAGWAARGEQNRAWHHNLGHQLAQTRAQLADALDALDDARCHCETERVPAPAPAVVHVHLITPAPRPAPRPIVANTARFVDAMPVLPAEKVQP